MAGGEKFLLKSKPHSPIATHSGLPASSVSDKSVGDGSDGLAKESSSSHDFASCGGIPRKYILLDVFLLN